MRRTIFADWMIYLVDSLPVKLEKNAKGMRLREQLINHLSKNIGETEVASLEAIG